MALTIDCGEGRHDVCIGYAKQTYLIPQLDGELFRCACGCHRNGMVCAHCDEAILPSDDLANIITMDAHRECALRSVVGGIGHLLDHAHFCSGVGPDAGLDYRTSALLVDVWIARKGIEATPDV